MGVQGLWDLVAPVGRRIPIETLEGKVLAVDISIWLTQFLAAMRDAEGLMVRNAHILGMFRRICKLLVNKVRPVFVFDGGVPEIKRRTIQARRRRRDAHAAELRRVAEKLLLRQLQIKNLDHYSVKGRKQKGPTKHSQENNMSSESLQQKQAEGGQSPRADFSVDSDRMLAESLQKEEDEKYPKSPQSISAGDVDINAEVDDDVDVYLPSVGEDIDLDVVSALPHNMKLKLVQKLSHEFRFADRDRLRAAKANPYTFSELQISSFLKNCDTGKRLKDLKQRVSNEAEGRLSSVQCVANRIASEPDREYIFRKETKFTYGSEEECPTEGEKELPGKDVTDNTEMPRRRRLRRNEDADSACVNELSISDEEHSDGGGGFFLPGHDSVPGENTNSSPAAPSARLISAASATGNDSPSHTPLLEKNAEWENNTVDEDVGGGFLECDRDDVSAVPPDHLEDSEMAGPDQNPPDSNVIQIQDFEGGIEKRGLGIVKPSSDLSDIRTLHSSGNIEVGEVVPPVQKSLGDARNGNDDVASNTKNEHDDADAASGVKSSNDDVVSDAKLTRKSGAENVSENEGDGSSVDWDETSNVSNSHDVQVSAEASQHGNDQLQMTSGAFESTDKQGGASGQDVSVMDALLSAMEAEVIADVKETAQSGIDGGKKLVSALEEGVRTEGNFEESFVHLLRKAATNNDGAIDLTDQPADATSPFSADVASVPIDVESSPVNATPTFPAEADSSSADVASVPIDVNSSTFDVAGMFSTGIAASDLDRPTEGAGSSGALDVTANGLGVEETMQKVDDAPLDDVELRDVAERQESLQKARAEIEIEVDALRRKEQKMQSTSSSGFSKDMLEETKQLLRLFGVPYIVSPMEAEAQCAYLEACNLVNGVVTEDSDCFLFGACDVYKNIFDEKKYVEVYKMRDLERELGVDREKLIHLAMLLGSDYTEGVRGVGIVNATEIVRAFPDRDRLKQFKEWVETFGDFGEENPEPNDPEAAIKRFKWTHRNMKRNWVIRPGFASDAIRKAYMEPLVDKSKETFQWGTPQLDALRELCRTKFLWSQTQADEYLLPVMQAAADRHTQMRIPNFFFSERFAKIRSSRMQAAVRGLAGDEHSAHLMSEPALKPLNKPPNPRKKRAPKPAKSAGAQTPEETTACSAPSPASTLAGETAVTRGGKRSSAVASRRAKKRPRVQSKTPPCSEGSAPDNGRSSELQSARALRRRGEASGDGDGDGGSSDSNRRSGGRSSGDDDFDPGACSSSGSSM